MDSQASQSCDGFLAPVIILRKIALSCRCTVFAVSRCKHCCVCGATEGFQQCLWGGSLQCMQGMRCIFAYICHGYLD